MSCCTRSAAPRCRDGGTSETRRNTREYDESTPRFDRRGDGRGGGRLAAPGQHQDDVLPSRRRSRTSAARSWSLARFSGPWAQECDSSGMHPQADFHLPSPRWFPAVRASELRPRSRVRKQRRSSGATASRSPRNRNREPRCSPERHVSGGAAARHRSPAYAPRAHALRASPAATSCRAGSPRARRPRSYEGRAGHPGSGATPRRTPHGAARRMSRQGRR